jgi:hypothetical protein
MAQSRSLSVQSVTASTTQTQAGGTVVNGDICLVTVANANDAVTLPANLPTGTVFYLVGGANAGRIYPPVGGTINAKSQDALETLSASVVHLCIVTASGSSSTYTINKLAVAS